jgi:hypothetical protein
MSSYDFKDIEALAKRLCAESGGEWYKKRTKKNHWRRKAKAQFDYMDFTRSLYVKNLPKNRFGNFIVWVQRLFG